ncbi:hypothetical protein L198_01818 [Cryptococcus wingfieldii CBS 7118]|uniref:Helicase C-terminal domain-containing protein n=1 Tax=Cryptococcus wingfieldii CBS 7118 TaxID=1295528 RepID=A0A1E3JWF7_9TREE|nr:hypothetical protein L198_01818 [Cryptococcus wingfieldii CBS 7118]ODO05130.1 hypothetical protein L198_01818 [Cryptococcus wingfieldii CBS 7118]
MAVARGKNVRNILMELRKVCQHPYLAEPELEVRDLPQEELHRNLVNSSGKLQFLKVLLPKLMAKGHRILLFSQFKISLDQIQDFLFGENILYLRLDGDTPQAIRQKNMDLFNAPNSPIGVFLLTTRAGGVGINLATADTAVILHDPDFNPHQDLQAIARAHRYGQTKKVLVFKLMIKGSVEGKYFLHMTIIDKGKRKMVLDHLVVQQLGKEPDENDYEDLFVKNVAGMYGNGGINIPDINYTSARVDELIEKVEADAEAEAQLMAEKHRKVDDGEIEAGVSKGGAQFAFAKIWEAEGDAIKEDEITDKNDAGEIDAEDEMDWESLMATIEKERVEKAARELEDGRLRRKQKAQEGIYRIFDEEDTPQKPNKKRRQSKGQGSRESDGDWVNNNGLSDAEKDSPLSGYDPLPDDDLKDLLSGHHVAQVGPSLHHPPKSLKRGQHKKPLSSRPTSSAPQPQTQRPSAPPLPSKHVHDHMVGLWEAIHGRGAGDKGRSKTDNFVSTHSKPTPKVPREIAEAQNIVQWMYHVIRELDDFSLIDRWAIISLPEVTPVERMDAYSSLAKDIDVRLAEYGEAMWFSNDEQVKAIQELLRSGFDVVPEAHPGPLGYPGGKAGMRDADRTPGSLVIPSGFPTPDEPMAPSPFHLSDAAPGPGGFQQDSPAGPSTSRPRDPCERCKSRKHDLRNCPEMFGVQTLEKAARVYHEQNHDAEQKALGMKALERMRNLLIMAGRIGSNYRIPGPSPVEPSISPASYKTNGGVSLSHSQTSKSLPPTLLAGTTLKHPEERTSEKVGAEAPEAPERLLTGQLREEGLLAPLKRKGKERETIETIIQSRSPEG